MSVSKDSFEYRREMLESELARMRDLGSLCGDTDSFERRYQVAKIHRKLSRLASEERRFRVAHCKDPATEISPLLTPYRTTMTMVKYAKSE